MMKVIGVGLNKTGTSTLGCCLKKLGFRVHGFDLELTRCFALTDIERILTVAEGFDGFQDWPWPLVFRELDDRFPASKFVLTVRKSPTVWLESLKRHARRSGPTEARRIAYGYEHPFGHEEAHLATYKSHNEAVREYFASRPHDLLEVCWEKGDDWSTLCRFLGVKVPDLPFPHKNKSGFLSYLPFERLPFRRRRLE